jgi:hypothetical protein
MRMTAILAIALLVSLLANVEQYRRAGVLAEKAKGAAATQSAKADGKLDRAADANAASVAAIDRLQLALGACEGERLIDQAFARAALAGANASRDEIARRFAALREQQKASQAGDCRAWAEAPTCGVMTP